MFRLKNILFLTTVFITSVKTGEDCIKSTDEGLFKDCNYTENNRSATCKCAVPEIQDNVNHPVDFLFNTTSCSWVSKTKEDQEIIEDCKKLAGRNCWSGFVHDDIVCNKKMTVNVNNTIECYDKLSCQTVSITCLKPEKLKMWKWTNNITKWKIDNENLYVEYVNNTYTFTCYENYHIESNYSNNAYCKNGIIENRPICIENNSTSKNATTKVRNDSSWIIVVICLAILGLVIFGVIKYRRRINPNTANKNNPTETPVDQEVDNTNTSTTNADAVYQVVDMNAKKKNQLTPTENANTSNADAVYQVVDMNVKKKNKLTPNENANEKNAKTSKSPTSENHNVELRNNPAQSNLDAEYVVIDLQTNPKNKYDSRLYESMSDYEQFHEKFAPKK